ncbi:MAG: hypothetical protein AUI53_02470 [Acidobacteria bacterium 13_1_40CM_2_60_7]|nr:MAG: hypothetical protein AUH88_02260 [Acidobacteria bacterium 13_1_40CM_4_61_5]OLD62198.1 MAG: hypothetical protein AUI53_02470 [Acidobacteria bacterium 13_1_40CM_2_60_7]
MARVLFSLLAALLALPSLATDPAPRPPIYSIAFVRLKSSNLEKANAFYGKVLALRNSFSLRIIAIVQGAPDSSGSLLDAIGFFVENLEQMHAYLTAQGVDCTVVRSKPGEVPPTVSALNAQGTPGGYPFSLTVSDPEGHKLIFFEFPLEVGGPINPREVSNRLIHAGFVVRNRAAMDRFYKDILGFHVYWHGGRKDDETDWVDMQVPDGTDWIEYMLNVPPNADHRLLGVMNHIALGVPDIHAAEKQLRANGWNGDEQPKIGRDGKWQLNLYDPDQTRVELMEFTPTKEPCCSPYTGPHPKP